MFSVTSTNKKTATIVNQIASVLQLELTTSDSEEGAESVSIENTVTYDIEEEMTIPLKMGDDAKDHYAIVSVSLSMDNKSDGYKSYGETLSDRESLIKGEIVEAFRSYTIEELKADEDVVKEDILNRLHKMFDSDFIYKISFRGIMLQ
jgi:flagellar FliL protein